MGLGPGCWLNYYRFTKYIFVVVVNRIDYKIFVREFRVQRILFYHLDDIFSGLLSCNHNFEEICFTALIFPRETCTNIDSPNWARIRPKYNSTNVHIAKAMSIFVFLTEHR